MNKILNDIYLNLAQIFIQNFIHSKSSQNIHSKNLFIQSLAHSKINHLKFREPPKEKTLFWGKTFPKIHQEIQKKSPRNRKNSPKNPKNVIGKSNEFHREIKKTFH